METLDEKHRKEKKELQAKVMALKKIIKGDKTKKKEITAEICKLESDLEKKHKTEVDEFQTEGNENEVQVDDDADETGDNIHTATKMSKAKKRRDKKAKEEEERNQRIKIQEKENLLGPRNLETQEITSKLINAHLKLHLIPSDGDCLYNAISHQLAETGRKVLQVAELREVTSNYIRNNKDEFLPFMSNAETYEMLTDSEFEDYCNAIASTKTWGGQLEVRALSNILKCPIHIVQGAGLDTVKQGEDIDQIPLVITYHRHMYGLGEHYNSSIKLPAESEEPKSVIKH